MTVHFVVCSVESVGYMRDTKILNSAVNLSLCKSIGKSRVSWYPDNTGLPAIKFNGCDVEWVFKTDAQRDKELERVLSLVTIEDGKEGKGQ